MTSTRFTDLVGCERPLQLAGMGDVSTVGLATAVDDAGGLGMLALPTSPAPSVEVALDALAGRTTGRIGINFLMPFLDPIVSRSLVAVPMSSSSSTANPMPTSSSWFTPDTPSTVSVASNQPPRSSTSSSHS